jgi:tartrate dehydratase beta subunit/fumarate hydratase class I family protein
VKVNLNQPMSEILALLSQYPVSTRLSLSGTIIVARDIAHAKLKELIDNGEALPQYVKDHPIYYAARPKRRTVTPPALLARPPQGAWTPTLICCSRTASKSCWRKATAASR